MPASKRRASTTRRSGSLGRAGNLFPLGPSARATPVPLETTAPRWHCRSGGQSVGAVGPLWCQAPALQLAEQPSAVGDRALSQLVHRDNATVVDADSLGNAQLALGEPEPNCKLGGWLAPRRREAAVRRRCTNAHRARGREKRNRPAPSAGTAETGSSRQPSQSLLHRRFAASIPGKCLRTGPIERWPPLSITG